MGLDRQVFPRQNRQFYQKLHELDPKESFKTFEPVCIEKPEI